MKKLTYVLSLSIGMLLVSSQAAFAQRSASYTGPNGGTVSRTYSNGQQTIIRRGPFGGSQQINRDFVNGKQTVNYNGPYGGTSTRTYDNGQQTINRKGPFGGTQQINRTFYP